MWSLICKHNSKQLYLVLPPIHIYSSQSKASSFPTGICALPTRSPYGLCKAESAWSMWSSSWPINTSYSYGLGNWFGRKQMTQAGPIRVNPRGLVEDSWGKGLFPQHIDWVASRCLWPSHLQRVNIEEVKLVEKGSRSLLNLLKSWALIIE